MNSNTHPLRYRLRGGRNVHAVTFNARNTSAITACGEMVLDKDERQYEGKPVTCSACARRLQGA
jgi:formylmethanofuran dehydrogenase subunit E